MRKFGWPPVNCLPEFCEKAGGIVMKSFRHFICALVAAALFAASQNASSAETDHADIKGEIAKRHDEAVKRLSDWIAPVSIAAEDRGYHEGAEYVARVARDAGFPQATVLNTDVKPGFFAA